MYRHPSATSAVGPSVRQSACTSGRVIGPRRALASVRPSGRTAGRRTAVWTSDDIESCRGVGRDEWPRLFSRVRRARTRQTSTVATDCPEATSAVGLFTALSWSTSSCLLSYSTATCHRRRERVAGLGALLSVPARPGDGEPIIVVGLVSRLSFFARKGLFLASTNRHSRNFTTIFGCGPRELSPVASLSFIATTTNTTTTAAAAAAADAVTTTIFHYYYKRS